MREMAAERARARLNDRWAVVGRHLCKLTELGSQMQGICDESELEDTYRTTFMSKSEPSERGSDHSRIPSRLMCSFIIQIYLIGMEFTSPLRML